MEHGRIIGLKMKEMPQYDYSNRTMRVWQYCNPIVHSMTS